MRREVEHGLTHSVRVLPVLWEDARLPAAGQLPPTPRGMLDWKALTVRHPSARRDLDRLVTDVRQALK